jgi:hypothetical protein
VCGGKPHPIEQESGPKRNIKVSGKEDSGFRPTCVTGFPLRSFQGFSGRVEVCYSVLVRGFGRRRCRKNPGWGLLSKHQGSGLRESVEILPSWIQFAENAAVGSHTYILEDGPELAKSSGPHAEDRGEILEGMYAQGWMTIEDSRIPGESGRGECLGTVSGMWVYFNPWF